MWVRGTLAPHPPHGGETNPIVSKRHGVAGSGARSVPLPLRGVNETKHRETASVAARNGPASHLPTTRAAAVRRTTIAAVTPPVIIVMHPSENLAKCSVWPLRDRSDLVFQTWPKITIDDRAAYVRLGLGGPPLSMDDADRGILLLDATWRYAERMERDVTDLPVRGLPPLETAYPRTSKLFQDPAGGLATVEALYAAYILTGRDPAGLLDHYRWAETFVERNPSLRR